MGKMMDAKLKEKWIAALRSGAYKQGRRKLKDGDKYCCLGVVCVVAGCEIDEAEDATRLPNGNYVYDDNYGPITNLGLNASVRSRLISMNDSGDVLFSEIADWIEANIPADVST